MKCRQDSELKLSNATPNSRQRRVLSGPIAQWPHTGPPVKWAGPAARLTGPCPPAPSPSPLKLIDAKPLPRVGGETDGEAAN